MQKKIVIISPGRDCTPWINALKKEEPNLTVEVYPEDTNRAETDFILTWNPPKNVFENYPNVKVIASMGAGIRHILKENKTPEQAEITKMDDPLLKEDMSYFVLTIALNFLRNIPLYFQQQNDEIWERKAYKRPEDISVGIMGFGNIGIKVGELLVKNKFKVRGWSKSKKSHQHIETFAGDKELNEFLKESNILVCLLPLTNETEEILSKKIFQQLPKGAYLINVGRGPHLVEEDLKNALEREQLSGAALDVFQEEPLPKEHWFWNHKKIQLTPHTASVTDPESISSQVIENLNRLKKGKKLLHTVSLEKGY
ncbi:2-hydroxyacid dehydrogenase [Mesonia maritima]|uniref:Glyoxylate/hydroxypyruvate reductase A n=1 Tax=Mesonia maritima TaxID=1793873 RepID=A0ABU1K8R8_9FLAO|nr:glyoxylate/hydroxypyruvate reductase A [Mesonia maritima]MDR6301999.1 glyoxylate/hydroxypyruvate reductase A [Mesonia maritima]